MNSRVTLTLLCLDMVYPSTAGLSSWTRERIGNQGTEKRLGCGQIKQKSNHLKRTYLYGVILSPGLVTLCFSLLLISRNLVLGNILFQILWILQNAFFPKKYSALWKGCTTCIWDVTLFAFYLGSWSQQEHCEDQLWRNKVPCFGSIHPEISVGKAIELSCLISKPKTCEGRSDQLGKKTTNA